MFFEKLILVQLTQEIPFSRNYEVYNRIYKTSQHPHVSQLLSSLQLLTPKFTMAETRALTIRSVSITHFLQRFGLCAFSSFEVFHLKF